jgi:glycerol-3-phosphate acyltransferase PlsY
MVEAPLAVVVALAAVGAYLLGSFPTGPLVAQARGVDLRAVGSGNIGAANATRALGRKLGIAVFAGDLVKGLVPVLVARFWIALPPAGVAAVGLTAFLGHLYPIYLRFRGGKGVATAAGIFFGMAPLATAIALGVWVLLFLPWRIVSLASLGAACAFPLALLALRAPLPIIGGAAIVLAFIIYKHRDNIGRLRKHAERKV